MTIKLKWGGGGGWSYLVEKRPIVIESIQKNHSRLLSNRYFKAYGRDQHQRVIYSVLQCLVDYSGASEQRTYTLGAEILSLVERLSTIGG